MLTDSDQMNEDAGTKQTWVSEGNLSKMLDTFSDYPSWITNIFKYAALCCSPVRC